MQEENKQAAGLGLLSAVAQRRTVNEIWFNRKTVVIDGFNFHGCRFDDCKLHVSSANFELRQCYVDENTVIYYHGEIVRVIRLFNRQYNWIFDKLPFFAPVKHENGTISIVV